MATSPLYDWRKQQGQPQGSAGIVTSTLNQQAVAAPAVTPTPTPSPVPAPTPAGNVTTQVQSPAQDNFAAGTSTLPKPAPGPTPAQNPTTTTAPAHGSTYTGDVAVGNLIYTYQNGMVTATRQANAAPSTSGLAIPGVQDGPNQQNTSTPTAGGFTGTVRGGAAGAEYDDVYENGVLISRTAVGSNNPVPIDPNGNQYKPGMPGTPGTPATQAPAAVSTAPPSYIQSLLDSIQGLTSKAPDKVNPVVAPQISAPSVSSELGALLSKGGDYMRRATQMGLNTANRRGLINSSLAGTAGAAAAIDAAAPLAQAQAQLGLSAAQSNQASSLQSLTQAQDINAQNARDQNLFQRETALAGLNQAAQMETQQREIAARTELAKLDNQFQMGQLDRQSYLNRTNAIELAYAQAEIDSTMQRFQSDLRVSESAKVDAAKIVAGLQGDAASSMLGLPTDYQRELTALMTTQGLSGDQLAAGIAALNSSFTARANYARLIANPGSTTAYDNSWMADSRTKKQREADEAAARTAATA